MDKKYNWREDPELRVWLMDSAPASTAIPGPVFEPRYRFVVRRRSGEIEVKNFVPEWALAVVNQILAADASVKDYFVVQTYKGSSSWHRLNSQN